MQVLTDESSTKPGNAAFEAEKASTEPPKTDAFVEAKHNKKRAPPLLIQRVCAPVSIFCEKVQPGFLIVSPSAHYNSKAAGEFFKVSSM